MAWTIFQVSVSTETPAKNGVFDGAWQASAQRLALLQRTCRDDIKLAVLLRWKASLRCKNKLKWRPFQLHPARASLAEDDGHGRFWRPARTPVILLVNTRFRRPQIDLSSVFAALRQLYTNLLVSCPDPTQLLGCADSAVIWTLTFRNA